MASDRIQRRIERLLDQVEEAADNQDWDKERTLAEEVLSLDPDNIDAQTFLTAAQRSLSRSNSDLASPSELVALLEHRFMTNPPPLPAAGTRSSASCDQRHHSP